VDPPTQEPEDTSNKKVWTNILGDVRIPDYRKLIMKMIGISSEFGVIDSDVHWEILKTVSYPNMVLDYTKMKVINYESAYKERENQRSFYLHQKVTFQKDHLRSVESKQRDKEEMGIIWA